MKSTRTPFFLASVSCGMLAIALLLALVGYFRSVDSASTSVSSEKRLGNQLKILHEQLKTIETPEQMKAFLKFSEAVTGLSSESEGARELKKAFSPLVSIFGSKPREAESRYVLGKKRELMENLVGAYREALPNGDLRVRAGYLNILFDVQSSLMNESDEAEQVFIKRSRERFDALKSLSGLKDPNLSARISALNGLFQGYERGYQAAVRWRGERAEVLAKLEKNLPAIAKNIYVGEDANVDDTRRSFIYVCFISILIAIASFLSLYLGFKVLKLRSDLKWDAFLAYLRGFGSDRNDSQIESILGELRNDKDWAPALGEARRAEEGFLRVYQNLLAVPRSIQFPFLVISKDKIIRHWNSAASALFCLTDDKEWTFEDLLRGERITVRDGQVENAIEAVRSSFSAITEDRFELFLKQSGEWRAFELTMSPIISGHMVGGKVLLWREIRGEAERMDRSIGIQIQRVRDLVGKISQGQTVSFMLQDTDTPSVRAMIEDLSVLKQHVDERELLWKSEASALIDQVSRQQEILRRLSEELSQIRIGQSEALGLVREVHSGEEHLHDELCVMERDLERWSASRKRLAGDIKQQSAVLDRARKFEEQLRGATEEMRSELQGYQKGLEDLRQFADSARVHSVNLSLVKDPAYWEYASRARAFAHDLIRFIGLAESLGQKIQSFLTSHPGGALAAHLSAPNLDEDAFLAISEEQEKISQLLKRWKQNGAAMLSEGERALEILHGTEQAGVVVSQLGETSLLINQQAKGNLERWN